ncbi:hypothetical protein TNCV_2645731 [Trichonephila clavipes]|nr:hypothetical protein TNCV_2645731 [Trichonephila clavipes]
MSTFNIPILPFFVHIFLKTTQLSCRRKQFNSPPQLENQSQCRRKTTQLVSRNETAELNRRKELNSATGTKQLNRRKQLNSAAGTNNSTRQQERNNSTRQ